MATPPRFDRTDTTPSTGTIDDEDNSNDERGDENEPPVREVDDRTEALEEFEVDDEDEPNESGGTLRLDDEAGGTTAGDEDWSDVEDDEDLDDDEPLGDDTDGRQDE